MSSQPPAQYDWHKLPDIPDYPAEEKKLQRLQWWWYWAWPALLVIVLLVVVFFSGRVSASIFSPTPVPTARPKPTATPIPTISPTPTSVPQSILNPKKHHLRVPIDSAGLLSGSRNARQSLVQQVSSQAFLQGHTVGFVVVYGNTNDSADPTQIKQALSVAGKVIATLKTIGKQFARASYYDPLYNTDDPNFTEIDIYLSA